MVKQERCSPERTREAPSYILKNYKTTGYYGYSNQLVGNGIVVA